MMDIIRNLGLEEDASSEILQIIKTGSLDNFTQNNIEALNKEIIAQVETISTLAFEDIDKNHMSSIQFLDMLESLIESSNICLIRHAESYIMQRNSLWSYITIDEAINKLETSILAKARSKQPLVFRQIDKKLNETLENSKKAIDNALSDCQGHTIRECYYKISEVIESQIGLYRGLILKIGKIPHTLINLYTENVKSYAESKWTEKSETNIRQLDYSFEIFCKQSLIEIQNNVIKLFDESRCSYESRLNILKILILTKPNNLDNATLDSYVNYFDIREDDKIALKSLDKNIDPELLADSWLNSTDPASRLFIILCLLLLLSNSHKLIITNLNDEQTQYSGISRQ